MKLAFFLDPLNEIKPHKDSSFAMMEEAASRGHELYVMHQEDIVLAGGGARKLEAMREVAWHDKIAKALTNGHALQPRGVS